MSSSFRMGHIASSIQEVLPFANDSSIFMRIWQKLGHLCPMDTFLVGLNMGPNYLKKILVDDKSRHY